MPVVVECTTLLIRNATVEARYPDGLAGFERQCPNSTFCTDGLICRVSFMHSDDALSYLDLLVGQGFLPSTPAASPEIALIRVGYGFLFPCSWLQVALAEVGSGQTAVIAWLLGTSASQAVAPPGWSLGQTFDLTMSELERDYEFVKVENGVETRRHRVTGQLIYQGRPSLPGRKRWWEFWK